MPKKLWVPATLLWWAASAGVVSEVMRGHSTDLVDIQRGHLAALAASAAVLLLAAGTVPVLVRSVRAAGRPWPWLRAGTVVVVTLAAVVLAALFAPAFATVAWPALAAGPALVFATLAGAAYTRAAAVVAPVVAVGLLAGLVWPLQAWAPDAQHRVAREQTRPAEVAASVAAVRAATFPIYTSPYGGFIRVAAPDEYPHGAHSNVITDDFGFVSTFPQRRDCTQAAAGDDEPAGTRTVCRRISGRVSVYEYTEVDPDHPGRPWVHSRVYVQMPDGVTVVVHDPLPGVLLADQSLLALSDQLRVVDPDDYTVDAAMNYLLLQGL